MPPILSLNVKKKIEWGTRKHRFRFKRNLSGISISLLIIGKQVRKLSQYKSYKGFWWKLRDKQAIFKSMWNGSRHYKFLLVNRFLFFFFRIILLPQNYWILKSFTYRKGIWNISYPSEFYPIQDYPHPSASAIAVKKSWTACRRQEWNFMIYINSLISWLSIIVLIPTAVPCSRHSFHPSVPTSMNFVSSGAVEAHAAQSTGFGQGLAVLKLII